MKFFLRWLITGVAVAAAILLVPGIDVGPATSAIFAVVVVAVVLAFLNVYIKPFLQFLSCGFLILTLGLFSLVINAFLLWLASWICQVFSIGFYVDGFWPAFWGGLVISVVTWFLSLFVDNSDDQSVVPPASY